MFGRTSDMSDLSNGAGMTDVEEELFNICWPLYCNDVCPHNVKQNLIKNAILGFVNKYGYNAAEHAIIVDRVYWRLLYSANGIDPLEEPPPRLSVSICGYDILMCSILSEFCSVFVG